MARAAKKKPAIIKDLPLPVLSKKVSYNALKKISPITPAQEQVFDSYKKGQNLFLHGYAGTGKSFLALYLALNEVMSRETKFEKVIVVRSAVPVRDQGFLPGTQEEKEQVYQLPYDAILKELFPMVEGNVAEKLKEQKLYQFITTSFIRGLTLKNCIVIVDECSSCDFHELDSVVTRVGENCKIIFAGDYRQSDLKKSLEKQGFTQFLSIINKLQGFDHVEFEAEDIVRSALVKAYIIEKSEMGIL